MFAIISEIFEEENLAREFLTVLGLDLMFEASLVFMQHLDECEAFMLERMLLGFFDLIRILLLKNLLVDFNTNRLVVLILDVLNLAVFFDHGSFSIDMIVCEGAKVN